MHTKLPLYNSSSSVAFPSIYKSRLYQVKPLLLLREEEATRKDFDGQEFVLGRRAVLFLFSFSFEFESMGTEILLPRDCLIERTRVPTASFYRRKCSYGNINNNFNRCSYRSNRKPAGRSERPDLRNRVISNNLEPSSMKRSSSDDTLMMNSLVTEKVTILRRGQSLDKSNKEGVDSETVPKQIRIVGENLPLAVKCDMYAGSAFYISPAPSSLPLPSFYKKKEVLVTVEDSATRYLRRLLRLEV